MTDFEAAYRKKGESLTYLTWYTKDGERRAERTESIPTEKGREHYADLGHRYWSSDPDHHLPKRD
ncbi:hypothetical protein [Lacrimispora xylanisolvens]|uniref:hypothetical protein n=1 Tax=Lacrimispora xylanisolvens TaxID=384636 RepID=UPI002402BDF2